ncbi:hypothetical protein GZ77_04420 [Endozoicomonas montiporae]|uniref:Uncharacterized protein n=1 Tax=Endozoicomonas montiporae TaxID=1027273 RepID=A0A081NBG4_9GAMM|nr:hypothetical protein [Endozoicomonas montiporae]KEQ15787.1 hypothetical protein GZ77_04420 [Endozoicomonas montiporae]
MPELTNTSFRLTFSERVQIFVNQKSLKNFVALFSGRSVSTSDPVIKLLKQKANKGSVVGQNCYIA